MRSASRKQGFTLIELLTVIAIIAVLVAILFPLAGTVREQARANSCMSNLHQLWVAANVYKQDEGGYPPALMGYVEMPGGAYLTDTSSPHVNADQIINGFLYKEHVKDINLFRCPDNPTTSRSPLTIAYFPPRPQNWPPGIPYIADTLASNNVCPTDSNGTVDCFTDGPLRGLPKFYYTWNSYDIGPRLAPDGTIVRDGSGNIIYDRHYSVDWTGVTGLGDLPVQLKYENPPNDKTVLTYCYWHAAIAGANSAPAISLAGNAKKVPLAHTLLNGANYLNR